MALYSLDGIQEKSKYIMDKYNIGRAVIFGSYARSEATDESDIDIH